MLLKNNPVPVLKHATFSKDLITYAKCIVAALANNPYFPGVSLVAVMAAIAALDAAETAAGTGAHGTAQDRNTKRLKLKLELNHLREYVQLIVETAVSVTQAATMIESAGMRVRKSSARVKPALSAKYSKVSGEVILSAKAVRGAKSYYWQFSLDQTNWSSAPETTQTSTTIGGLTPGHVYYFRFRTLGNAGLSDYSQVVNLHVV